MMISNGKLDFEGERLIPEIKKLTNSKNVLPQIGFEQKVDHLRMQN